MLSNSEDLNLDSGEKSAVSRDTEPEEDRAGDPMFPYHAVVAGKPTYPRYVATLPRPRRTVQVFVLEVTPIEGERGVFFELRIQETAKPHVSYTFLDRTSDVVDLARQGVCRIPKDEYGRLMETLEYGQLIEVNDADVDWD